MYSKVQSTVTVGDITSGASTSPPFLRIGKVPTRLRDISICVDTDYTPTDTSNYFEVAVVRIDRAGAIEWTSQRYSLKEQGMKAYVWHLLHSDTNWVTYGTYAIKVFETGTGATMSNVTVAFDLEEREDG